METILDDNYLELEEILLQALEQASGGKGAERHGQDKPFEEQPMMKIQEMVGQGFALGQAIKKIQESSRFKEPERRKAELLGAINYIAGAILFEEKSLEG